MSTVQISLFPIDHRPVSDRTTAESSRQSQSFSTFLERSSFKQDAFPQDRVPSSPSPDRQAHEQDRAGRHQRPAPLQSSRKSPSTMSHRSEPSHEVQEPTTTASWTDHHSAEIQDSRGRVTGRTEDSSEQEQDQSAEHDQTAEQDDMDGSQPADVMIGLCLCLAESVPVNEEPKPLSDDASALVVTIESASASAQITIDVSTTEQSPQSVGPLPTDPNAALPPLDSAHVKDGQKPSSEPQSGFAAPLVPAGDQKDSLLTGTQPATQPVVDPATLVSDVPAPEEVVSKNEPLRVSNGVSFASDAFSNRNTANGIDTWHYGDHPATDPMVEQRTLPEWSQSGGGQEGGMGERDDRAAGGGTESPRPGQYLAREGFGETVAAVAADRAAQMEGTASRAVPSPAAGRAASSWSHAQDGFSMVQTVNLNLEPADLGPVNVRIFMTDRTVHAHITTDHMDFGQGMLSQQQQLETKLHSSGLEMGEFKVTVDHQQLSRGDSQNWFGHQGDRNPSTVDSLPREPEQEAREAPPVERRHVGIMSFFA